MNTFERLESEVRSYCRSFPTVFRTAKGSTLVAEDGTEYLDFFAGAGALNYGHNPSDLREALVAYLLSDGVTHSLDMMTTAKGHFIETFEEVVLAPRKMDHKVLFPGPTGTNAVEVALKIARKVTGRSTVVSFTNGFHGMTLGSLALTGNQGKRDGAGIPLDHVSVMPFDGYHGDGVDTLAIIEKLLTDGSSGVDMPAAFVLETVQAEGGVHPARQEWLEGLAALAKRLGVLLILDDIQVGCGRTGPFFSFDGMDLVPDMVCLSKSLSGYGLPMSMVLLRPEHDVLEPGEHNGTFRGHMPAFVTATAALERWRDDSLTKKVEADAAFMAERLGDMALGRSITWRGRGFIQGLVFEDPEQASAVSKECYERGLIIETAGPDGEVVKLLPPLVIERAELERGLSILERSVELVVDGPTPRPVTTSGREVSA